jgi:hypothetical protein
MTINQLIKRLQKIVETNSDRGDCEIELQIGVDDWVEVASIGKIGRSTNYECDIRNIENNRYYLFGNQSEHLF